MTSNAERRGSLINVFVLMVLPAMALAVLILLWHPWRVDPYEVPADKDVFTVASGSWDWVNADSLCVADPYQISFTPDHDLMYLTFTRPAVDSAGNVDSGAVYDVVQHSRSHIRGAMHQEARLTEDGKPVVWDLVMMSPHTLAWRRTDWTAGQYTVQAVRCTAPRDSTRSDSIPDPEEPVSNDS